jgi:cytochrome o ubiquinol oxidase operon protein cyoD
MSTTHNYPEQGGRQKTLGTYVTGLVLCVILTLIAFGLVEKRLLSDSGLYIALAGLAIVQLFVQSTCFLRLNSSAEGRWNLLPFLFALLIIAVLVSGSLWIMYNLNYNMMN